ncbi:hypothetical protein ABI59_02820 [Acidobacteria bacterium Mor1]|nr:hypothetical protein ABI59_02820 [Acidobacteria bacterium Mor1]
MKLETYLAERRERIDGALERLLPPDDGPAATVSRAMRYAVFGGGKRLRPVLAVAAYEACGGAGSLIDDPAAALEMIHTYSLVHDDLPAMDDAALRRGRTTVHREFGEAEAVLAGDGLLTLAFEVLARYPAGDEHASRRSDAVVAVARASGVAGMVGGQMADIEGERKPVDRDGLEWIHRHKTGTLLASSAELGAIVAGATEETRDGMRRFASALGLAFQIADDLLDATSTSETLGKAAGADAAAGKSTYPSLYGIERSREMADAQIDLALGALSELGLPDDGPLAELARFTVRRST